MAKSYTDTDKGMKDIFAEMQKLSEMHVLVGFPEDSGEVERDGGESIDIAQIATWNHFGTEHIPSRPFMTDAIDNNRERIESLAKILIAKIMSGKIDAETAMRQYAEAGIRSVQKTISHGNFRENAASTLAKKGSKGQQSSRPLIDTGRMRNSVQAAIIRNGAEIERVLAKKGGGV